MTNAPTTATRRVVRVTSMDGERSTDLEFQPERRVADYLRLAEFELPDDAGVTLNGVEANATDYVGSDDLTGDHTEAEDGIGTLALIVVARNAGNG